MGIALTISLALTSPLLCLLLLDSLLRAWLMLVRWLTSPMQEPVSTEITEAMAAGLASVVTDVGENAHLIENGVTGRIVPPEDPQALADALRALIQNPSLCGDMGSKARTKAQQYGVERMVARTLGVYERVLHER